MKVVGYFILIVGIILFLVGMILLITYNPRFKGNDKLRTIELTVFIVVGIQLTGTGFSLLCCVYNIFGIFGF